MRKLIGGAVLAAALAAGVAAPSAALAFDPPGESDQFSVDCSLSAPARFIAGFPGVNGQHVVFTASSGAPGAWNGAFNSSQIGLGDEGC